MSCSSPGLTRSLSKQRRNLVHSMPRSGSSTCSPRRYAARISGRTVGRSRWPALAALPLTAYASAQCIRHRSGADMATPAPPPPPSANCCWSEAGASASCSPTSPIPPRTTSTKPLATSRSAMWISTTSPRPAEPGSGRRCPGYFRMHAVGVAVLVGEDTPPSKRLLRGSFYDGDTVGFEGSKGRFDIIDLEHHAGIFANAGLRRLERICAGCISRRLVEQNAGVRAGWGNLEPALVRTHGLVAACLESQLLGVKRQCSVLIPNVDCNRANVRYHLTLRTLERLFKYTVSQTNVTLCWG